MYTYFIKYKTQHDTYFEYVSIITRDSKLTDNKELADITKLLADAHGVNIKIHITHISIL